MSLCAMLSVGVTLLLDYVGIDIPYVENEGIVTGRFSFLISQLSYLSVTDCHW